MQVYYDSKNDLLYLRFDDGTQKVVNRRVSEDIVLDVGRDNRIVGIEILDASRHVRMENMLPIEYKQKSKPEFVMEKSKTKYGNTSKRGREIRRN